MNPYENLYRALQKEAIGLGDAMSILNGMMSNDTVKKGRNEFAKIVKRDIANSKKSQEFVPKPKSKNGKWVVKGDIVNGRGHVWDPDYYD